MGSISVACYKPKPGCESALLELVRGHLPPLRAEGLVTDRASIVMRAADGTITVRSGDRFLRNPLKNLDATLQCWICGSGSRPSAPTKRRPTLLNFKICLRTFNRSK
jgi:hypothetical protein